MGGGGSLCFGPQKNFVDAAGMFQLEDVKFFLEEGVVNVNGSMDGVTALGNACFHNCVDVVEALCDEPGIDVNGTSLVRKGDNLSRLPFSSFQTPLYAACRFNSNDCVAILMKHKDIDPNKGCCYAEKSSNGVELDIVESPLGVVSRLGYARSANYILSDDSVNPNFGSAKFGSCLRCSLMNNNASIAENILKHPTTNINCDDDLFPRTPILTLSVSIRGVRPELVELLLSRPEMDLRGEKSASSLIRSLISRRQDILDLLLQQPRIEVNAPMKLSHLKSKGLVIRGQKIEKDEGVDKNRIQNVLLYACSTLRNREKHMKLLESILKHPKIDLNARESEMVTDEFGATPFFIAAKRNLVIMCKKILEIGGIEIDVDAKCTVIKKSGVVLDKKKKFTAFEVTTNEEIKKMIVEHKKSIRGPLT